MLTTLSLVTVLALADPPAREEAPGQEQLAAITARGRALAAYDDAAWHASDALKASKPREGRLDRYIARKTDRGWTVAFGRLDIQGEAFEIAYEATRNASAKTFTVAEKQPATRDTGFFLAAARAIDTVLKEFVAHFEGEQRPYNVAVLPADKDQLWVYLVPAQTRDGVWPLGGDARYLVSPDGKTIVTKRPLHKSIIEVEPPNKEGQNQQVAGIHTHVLDNIPEDTDVFHVLRRKPAVPELVVTPQFVYQVDPDGHIRFLGKADEVLKRK